MVHKWWHFIYGKEFKLETVARGNGYETCNGWEACKKCGAQIGEKYGYTHLGPFEFTVTTNSK